MKHLVCAIILCLLALPALAESGKLVHVVSFNDYESGSVEDWLLGKGFQFKHDAQYRNLIDLDVDNSRLLIESRQKSFGIIINETVNVSEFSFMEVDWGVNVFPEGSSYEQGVRNEAIMVMIFMGDELQPSGSLLIPNSPYFVGLFLCHDDDRINHPYVGTYFKKGGRYVCGDKPKAGEAVTTRFNLLKAYRAYFDKEKDDDPAVSGLAIALDTKKAKGSGKSSAFIKEIRFYK